MNTKDSNLLIAESEIRAALSLIRIDRDAFDDGVRQRVKLAAARPASFDDVSLHDHEGLLRIAASVLPVNLLGVNAASSKTSLATLGFFPKAFAFLALPAVAFLMIAITVGSWIRIRSAQQSQSLPDADLAQMQDSLKGWWRRYGWIAAIVFVMALLAPFMGWNTPLLLLFTVSAVGTASIVTTLGRAGLVDRNVIGGYCIGLLGILGQVSNTFAISNDTQLLDPKLVTAAFFAGAAVLFFFVNPLPPVSGLDAKSKKGTRNIVLTLAGLVCLLILLILSDLFPKPLLLVLFAMMAIGGVIHWVSLRSEANRIVAQSVALILLAATSAFFSQTLWRPVGNSALVHYAETFDPELVGGWSYWQPTARWLQEQGVDYDLSAVQSRWRKAWKEDDSSRTYLLNHGVSTGLVFPPDVIETDEFKATVQRMLSPDSADTQIFSIDQYEYVIAELVKEGALTNEQRDHLAGRLLATWRTLNEDRIQQSLVDATTITNLLTLIDRPLAEAERRADVARWLGEYQVVKNRPFTRSGGFRRYSTGDQSDLLSTEHAVRLMQHYETHDSVDVLALRVFLRASSSDRQLMMTASVKASALQRLDQIPGISQPSLWDHIRLNQSLWFAMLLVGLCIYATLGSPQILSEVSDNE